jgi:small ligand-binding sensory domain FIST
MTGPIAVPSSLVRSGYGSNSDWHKATDAALAELAMTACDVLVVAASSAFQADLPAIATHLWSSLEAPILFGSSTPSVLIEELEPEHQDGIGLMGLSLPGATIASAHISRTTLESTPDGASLRQRLNVIAEDVNSWIVLADPFHFDSARLVALLGDGFPHAQIVGGLVAPDAITRRSMLVINNETHDNGAILLGIGGPYAVFPVHSHGTDPIGVPWTITACDGEWIQTIGGRTALEVIDETLRRVPPDLRTNARANLLTGFAINEYRSDFVRSDFVVRSITGVNTESGAIAVGYHCSVGQTIQFQLRDPATADLDLTLCLDGARLELTGRRPLATLVFVDEGRGTPFFGRPHHDARLIRKKIPSAPLLGMAASAEIGPADNIPIVNTGGLVMGVIFRTT